MKITVSARKSPLSKAQVEETLLEIRKYHPDIYFESIFIDTTGDLDLQTSLRNLDKTNFFTKELDELLLEGKCQIAVHSAKDLPDPLLKGLKIAAITKGLDSRDVLVLRKGETLRSLKKGAIIALSSKKRKEAIRALREDLSFQDIRGPIHTRLKVLDSKKADGVVIAEAALIRLKLTHLNRIYLTGETTPLQGQLAILTQDANMEMLKLFSCLDSRN
ncbi:MAG TPA: hydroxymethylbilane synthase [Parachlamydiaceae bacterium]|nr:hydroxymethylbilane synthase [Parachlamydiaceae bacterium]